MEPRDKNGLTEQEFLAFYNADKYPRPSLTADVAIFAKSGESLQLLLIRRGGHPYLGRLALPGGFANKNESLEESAAQELQEETGISGVPLTLVGIFSKPGRDPRGWVVSAAYLSIVDAAAMNVQAGDDASDAQWYDVSLDDSTNMVTLSHGDEQLLIIDGKECSSCLAFDHAEIIFKAVRKLV